MLLQSRARSSSSYFVQPVAYVVMTVFLLLGGFFFFALLRYFEVTLTAYSAMQNPEVLQRFNLNERVIEPLLHNLSVVLVILVPAITMRTFAEEKRTGTYELLLTAPIRTGEIVAGKVYRGRGVCADHDRAGRHLPADPGLRQSGDRRNVLGLPGTGVAVGLLRRDRIVYQLADPESDHRGDQLLRRAAAAVRDIVAGCSREAGRSRVCCAISRCRSISPHGPGVIDTSDLVYFPSVIFVALFLTQRSVESARWR